MQYLSPVSVSSSVSTPLFWPLRPSLVVCQFGLGTCLGLSHYLMLTRLFPCLSKAIVTSVSKVTWHIQSCQAALSAAGVRSQERSCLFLHLPLTSWRRPGWRCDPISGICWRKWLQDGPVMSLIYLGPCWCDSLYFFLHTGTTWHRMEGNNRKFHQLQTYSALYRNRTHLENIRII